jgi:hypothetical protein
MAVVRRPERLRAAMNMVVERMTELVCAGQQSTHKNLVHEIRVHAKTCLSVAEELDAA